MGYTNGSTDWEDHPDEQGGFHYTNEPVYHDAPKPKPAKRKMTCEGCGRRMTVVLDGTEQHCSYCGFVVYPSLPVEVR